MGIGGSRPLLGWRENANGTMYVDAVVKGSSTNGYADPTAGAAGFIEYDEGGPQYRHVVDCPAAPKLKLPAVAVEAGKPGDRIRCQVFGLRAGVEFPAQLDTTSDKYLQLNNGAVAVGAAAAIKANQRFGVAVGGAASKTQTVYLFGTFVWE